MLETAMNAFHRTLVDFDCPQEGRDLFSAACIEEFDDRPKDRYGYMFAQVFEPHVLDEIERLEKCAAGSLDSLNYGEGDRLDHIRMALQEPSGHVVEHINLAAALISISRFKLAERTLANIDATRCTLRDQFEMAMLSFVVANRRSNKVGVRAAFAAMRTAGESGNLPADRLLDAAALAVVWRRKGEQVDEENYRWFLAVGHQLAEHDTSTNPGARSSWFRAAAMIPAARGEVEETRSLMLKAQQSAEEALDARPGAYAAHFVKTYYESTLKEQLYVAKDTDAALEAATALIALDPVWSPSYGEKAEVYYVAKQFETAAKYWEKAGRCGPPYVGHHYFSAAQAWEAADAPERALAIYTGLAALDPSVETVRRRGRTLASQLGADDEIFNAPDQGICPITAASTVPSS